MDNFYKKNMVKKKPMEGGADIDEIEEISVVLPAIRVWKISFCEKKVLNYETLGFPFIKGFPSHERDETHPLTMIGSQVC